MAKSTATVLITRSSGGPDGKPYCLTIADDVSGCQVSEVNMTSEQFAAMLTGASTPGVDVEWRGVANIGKTREIKTVELFMDQNGNQATKKAAARKIVAEHEVDGWCGTDSDLVNMHRQVQGKPHGTRRVTFVRFVDGGPKP